MNRTLTLLDAARRVSTPLIAIRTADPSATIEAIRQADFWHPDGKKSGYAALLSWNIVTGLSAIEREKDKAEPSRKALLLALGDAEPANSTNPVEALQMIAKTPPGTIAFFHNAQRFLDDAGFIQAVWNLRDIFKANMRTLVMLCPSLTLPPELTQDILILDEPLPTDKELAQIALKLYDEVSLPAPDQATQEKIIDATLGLAAFPAEQAMAMSLTRKGVDFDQLWERKKQAINSAPGLSVWNGGETFADIGGCENIKRFLRAIIRGQDAPRSIIWIDEIEKSIGTGQDTSGVSQNMLGQLLTWMQDNTATGIILIGPPGAAKSAIAKATGNEANVPTIGLDLGGMKASLVGESEGRLRNALKVVDAVSQKRALFVATCNSISVLPPELRRRFTFGTFFFALPSKAEREAIWCLYLKKYKLDATQELPEDEGWTGAEIKQACELSYRLQLPVTDCASYIVPVSRSASDQINKLCREADGRYISASEPGLYRYQETKLTPITQGRRVSFAE